MSAGATTRVGWCPGARLPMRSGDGLLVRVKPRLGALSPVAARGLAAAAARFGNGLLDLTGRANLQLRGLREDGIAGLTAALDRLGLVDADAAAEARRNVVASPLAGLDPAAAFDIRPAAAALEDRLAAESGLAPLPAKFGFAVSDGGRLRLGDVPADLRFEALHGATGAGRFAVRLDGEDAPAAICDARDLPETAIRLARGFLDARGADPEIRRMRDLVARGGGAAAWAHAGLDRLAPCGRVAPLPSPLWRGAGGEGPDRPAESQATLDHGLPDAPSPPAPLREGEGGGAPRPPPGSPRSVGVIRLADARDAVVLGIAAPFGRLDAAQLEVLAAGAARAGAGELRLTPWRAILVPRLDAAMADRLARQCAAAGLIVDPADPRLAVAACIGAPGCLRATTAVLEDAARWARHLPLDREGGIRIHVSGCAKGCAHPGRAPLTVVAREGRYALVADGTPDDLPFAARLDAAAVDRLLVAGTFRDGPP